jgi:hypothetical protein
MVYIDPANPRFTSIMGWSLSTQVADTTITRATSIHGAPDQTSASPWVISNFAGAPSLGGLAASARNVWTSTTGANLCYRWENGVKTTTPLWPWPMNERIKAATVAAGAYRGPCLDCTGGRLARTEYDITASIEALLGTIPSACRRQ